MLSILAEFFGIAGVDIAAPETMGELIPYLLTVLLAFLLVGMVFALVRDWVSMLFGPRRM